MKILIVTPTPTHPPRQGNRVRTALIAEAFLRAGALVDIVYYALEGIDPIGLDAMREAWNSVTVVDPQGFERHKSFEDHWGIDDWVAPALLDCMEELAATRSYDAVIVHYVWCSAILDRFPRENGRPLRIIDTHDAFGHRAELMRAVGLKPDWYYTSESEEARGLRRADIVLAVQQEEGRYFASIAPSRVLVIESAWAPEPLSRRSAPAAPEARLRIGYIGSANPWNRLAVLTFDRLFNAARADFGDTPLPEVLIFGGLSRWLKNLSVCNPAGSVVDVRDAYASVDLMINPMVGGSGFKIKTVESLIYGRPIVSTVAGAIGIEWLHPDLAHADVESLVRRILELSRDRDAFEAMSRSMMDAYPAFHSAVAVKLDGLIAEVRKLGEAMGPRL
jgi:glycosyltransferase involved in cell wall biosynthesis